MRLKMRGTVSRLWAKTSGWDSNTICSSSGLFEKSGVRFSTPVFGFSSWILRTTSAYSQAPSSSRSSRVTPVTVAYLRPISRTDSATRRGSSRSRGVGLPDLIWQKSQRREQVSPPMRKDASRSSQHSWIFGQPASWHTVCRLMPVTRFFMSRYSGPIFAVVRIQRGLASMGV